LQGKTDAAYDFSVSIILAQVFYGKRHQATGMVATKLGR